MQRRPRQLHRRAQRLPKHQKRLPRTQKPTQGKVPLPQLAVLMLRANQLLRLPIRPQLQQRRPTLPVNRRQLLRHLPQPPKPLKPTRSLLRPPLKDLQQLLPNPQVRLLLPQRLRPKRWQWLKLKPKKPLILLLWHPRKQLRRPMRLPGRKLLN